MVFRSRAAECLSHLTTLGEPEIFFSAKLHCGYFSFSCKVLVHSTQTKEEEEREGRRSMTISRKDNDNKFSFLDNGHHIEEDDEDDKKGVDYNGDENENNDEDDFELQSLLGGDSLVGTSTTTAGRKEDKANKKKMMKGRGSAFGRGGGGHEGIGLTSILLRGLLIMGLAAIIQVAAHIFLSGTTSDTVSGDTKKERNSLASDNGSTIIENDDCKGNSAENYNNNKKNKKNNIDQVQLQTSSSSSEKEEEDHHELLLTVPFYVYEELVWENATLDGRNISDIVLNHIQPTKHHDDYWLMLASLRHPMRTKDPSKAKLFYIPALFNFHDVIFCIAWYDDRQDDTVCWNDMCRDELLNYAADVLESSIWYQKYPERHIADASFYTSTYQSWHEHGRPERMKNILNNINLITFENGYLTDSDIDTPVNSLERLRIPKLHVGTPCYDDDNDNESENTRTVTTTKLATTTTTAKNKKQLLEKKYDIALIASMHPENPKFQDRTDICNWIGESNIEYLNGNKNNDDNNNDTTTTPLRYINMPICGQGIQCPTLGYAKYGFHVRGDSWGSNRLMDLLLSGTVPIFTHPEQYSAIGDWYDWDKISYMLPMTEEQNEDDVDANSDSTNNGVMISKKKKKRKEKKELFLNQLQMILNDDENGYQRKYQSIIASRHLFDHETIYPLDQFLYRLQIELFPETKHPITNPLLPLKF